MEKQKPYQHSSADIQKYLSGEMSALEMHELESAALNDNFLADAIDGYAKHEVSNAALLGLKEKIQQIKQPKQNNSKQIYFYLSLAASFIFILFFGYQFFNNDSQEQVLMAQKETKAKTLTQVPASKETTSKITSKKDDVALIVDEKPAVSLPKVNSSIENSSDDNTPLLSSIENITKDVVENYDTRIVENTVSPPNVEDENSKTGNVEVKTDANELSAFADVAKEEVTVKTTAAVKAVPQTSTLDKVALKKTIEPNRKSNSYPLIGWNEYQNYINNNIKKPFVNTGVFLNGAVVVAFKINQKGKPHAVRIIQSLSEACDKEAIRLIESGPEWKKADNKEVNYIITF